MTAPESKVFRPSPTEEDTHPHACTDGLVFLGHLVEDENGDEVEEISIIPCHRCADSR
jgi:hypothetical protein